MGFNLGLGLAAYGGYQARDRQIKAEDYQDRQRAYGTAQMDAEQPGLQDAADARSAANRLSTAQNTAELNLVPARAKLADSQLGYAQGLSDIKNEALPSLAQQSRNKSAIDTATSDQAVEMLPSTLTEQVAKGAMSLADAQRKFFSGIKAVAQLGKEPLKRYINTGKSGGVLGDMLRNSPDIADVNHSDAGGGSLVLINTKGEQIPMAFKDMDQWASMGQEFKPVTLKEGEVLASFDPRTGKVASQFSAPESESGRLSKLPSDARMIDYLIKRGIYHDEKEAWAGMHDARSKTEGAYVADYVARWRGAQTMAPTQTQLREIREEARDVYRNAYKLDEPAGRQAGASNSGSVPTLSKNVAPMFTDQ